MPTVSGCGDIVYIEWRYRCRLVGFSLTDPILSFFLFNRETVGPSDNHQSGLCAALVSSALPQLRLFLLEHLPLPSAQQEGRVV